MTNERTYTTTHTERERHAYTSIGWVRILQQHTAHVTYHQHAKYETNKRSKISDSKILVKSFPKCDDDDDNDGNNNRKTATSKCAKYTEIFESKPNSHSRE